MKQENRGYEMIVGYVAGVYDLFHIGHLTQLKCAKALCDRLIVGVITDELAEEYKGKRPVIPLRQRMVMIEALRCVDAVVECTTRDFYKQWEMIKYDVAFSGEDWYEDAMYLEWDRKLRKHGVFIRFLPNTSNISTSGIHASIRGKK